MLLCQLLTWEPGLWASAPAGHSAPGRRDTMKSLLLNTRASDQNLCESIKVQVVQEAQTARC